MAEEDEPLPDPLDDGLHYPRRYAFATWLEHEKHGTFPNGLAYDEQPVKLLQDWAMLDKRYGEIDDGLRAAGDSAENYLPPTLLEMPVDVDAPPAPPIIDDTPRGLLKRRLPVKP